MQLNSTALENLPSTLAKPTYDRSSLSAGIVHFGVGGFHRAHQAMYLDRLMNKGLAHDFAICGVGVLPNDARMKDVMARQDCLYTLVVKNPDGSTEARIIGSMIEYLFAPDDPEAVIEKMASEQVRIVSLTVTEGGYNFHHITGEFNQDNPDVAHDLQHGAVPRTVFGLVTEALVRRRARGLGAFTVMSCDNIQGNGDTARKMFTTFVELKDPELGSWVRENVPFPNSMVDRITPVTTDEDQRSITQDYGMEDEWPVVCEPFEQWVLEDHFSQGRPAFDEVGVQLVENVEPYELMKLRLLNVSHQALCYFGYLAGYRYVHEVCQDPLFSGFVRDYMDKEATPTLQPVPGIDLEDYKNTLIQRFSNEHVKDTLVRLCAESSDRIPKWLLPIIRINLAEGGNIDRSAAIVASWARYDEGIDEQGQPIEVVDRLKETLMAAAAKQRDEPLAFIANRNVFGDLTDNERFVESYSRALKAQLEQGSKATLESLRTATTQAVVMNHEGATTATMN